MENLQGSDPIKFITKASNMYFPVIDRKKCTNCKACAYICPKHVFDRDSDVIEVSDPTNCNGCQACVAECPEEAVRIDEL